MALGYSTSELLNLNQPTIPGCIDIIRNLGLLRRPRYIHRGCRQTHRRNYRPSGTLHLTPVNVQPQLSDATVRDCLQTTDWGVFRDAADINDYTEVVSERATQNNLLAVSLHPNDSFADKRITHPDPLPAP